MDPTVSRLAADLAALRKQVAELQRHRPGGTGVSTAFGATNVRTMQPGFEAELTSPYSTTTGYAWKRLELDITAPEVVNPDIQLTGNYAFTVDDNRGLVAGTRVWMESTPNATGYIVIPATDAGGGGVGCAEAAGWGVDDCLELTVVSAGGACGDIDATQVLTLVWDAGDSRWESGDDAVDVPEDDFTHDNGIGPIWFRFVNGEPELRIDSVYGFYLGCDAGSLVFAFGGTTLCDGDHVACGDNTFRVKIACACCDVAGWDGAGWYCVEGGATDTCQHLETACDAAGLTLNSGPHATQEECEDECDTPATVELCGLYDVPTTLYLTFSNRAGCSELDPLVGVTVALTYTPSLTFGSSVGQPGWGSAPFTAPCTGGFESEWRADFIPSCAPGALGSSSAYGVSTGQTAGTTLSGVGSLGFEPLLREGTMEFLSAGFAVHCCYGGADGYLDITISETAP